MLYDQSTVLLVVNLLNTVRFTESCFVTRIVLLGLGLFVSITAIYNACYGALGKFFPNCSQLRVHRPESHYFCDDAMRSVRIDQLYKLVFVVLRYVLMISRDTIGYQQLGQGIQQDQGLNRVPPLYMGSQPSSTEIRVGRARSLCNQPMLIRFRK